MTNGAGQSGGPIAHCPLPTAVHLVGIGGMHMSAIAQILLANGSRVSGSDQARTALTEKLRALGADVRYGHARENVGQVDLVVTTAAANAENLELVEAQRRGIPVISRAAMVARLMEGHTGVCVAGTHGKTTTSSMIAWMLTQAGRNPTFLLGGESVDLGTNAAPGAGDEIVVEADEYARAFLEYRPKIAVVTNVEADHLEYYGSVDAYEDAFRQFMQRVRPDGVIIACADSPRLAELAAKGYPARVETYGLAMAGPPPIGGLVPRQRVRGLPRRGAGWPLLSRAGRQAHGSECIGGDRRRPRARAGCRGDAVCARLLPRCPAPVRAGRREGERHRGRRLRPPPDGDQGEHRRGP